MMTETLVVNNVEMQVVVKTLEEMRTLEAQDREMASGFYTKGNTRVYQFGKAGCVTYGLRLREKRLVRKVWRDGV